MKAWDISAWEFPGADTPPAVVLGTETRLASKPKVNILFCSSKRATREAEPLEVILDEADRLDWETPCKCNLLFGVPKEQLTRKRDRCPLNGVGRLPNASFARWAAQDSDEAPRSF